jgi:PilZ domain
MTSATSPAENEAFSFEMSPPAPFPPDLTQSECLSLELPLPDLARFEAPSAEAFSFELTQDALSFEPSSADRREKAREVIRVEARICLDGESPLDVHTIDLSAHGLAINSTRPLNVGQECTVELGITVPEIAQPAKLRASVRYCARLREDKYRIGMKFTNVSVEAAELIVAVLGL